MGLENFVVEQFDLGLKLEELLVVNYSGLDSIKVLEFVKAWLAF